MLLRRISTHLTKNHWLTVILDVLVVIIGILLALQVNNWNESRIEREKEQAILEQLLKNLETNTHTLQTFLAENQTRDAELKYLLSHIEQKKPINETIGVYLRRVRLGEFISLNSSAFESLKSIGFELISCDSLRYSIIDLYNQTYEKSLSIINSINDVQYQSTHEIFVKYFSYSDQAEAHVLIENYETFLNTPEIYNLISFRRAGKRGVIRNAKEMLSKTSDLKSEIIEYLEK